MDFSSTTLDNSVRMVSQSLSFTSTLDGMAVINSEAEGMARMMGTSGRLVGADTRVTWGTNG